MRVITFYFDFISPYSYLGWQAIHPLAARHDAHVEPVPVLFAGLLNHHGHKGPGEIPAKRVYIYRDCLRKAAALGVPFEPPVSHPFKPLLALRVSALSMSRDTQLALIDRLFNAVWAQGLDVSDPDVVGAICAELGVSNAVERAGVKAIKDQLRAQTADAITRGVFGVPTVIVDEELFWGIDSFPHLERFLEGRDPVSPDDLRRWRAVPISAER